MLEYKRSLLVRMALEADRILRRGVPHLLGLHRPVHVVAVTANQQAFVDAMVERHFEIAVSAEGGSRSRAPAGISPTRIPCFARDAVNGRKCNLRRRANATN